MSFVQGVLYDGSIWFFHKVDQEYKVAKGLLIGCNSLNSKP